MLLLRWFETASWTLSLPKSINQQKISEQNTTKHSLQHNLKKKMTQQTKNVKTVKQQEDGSGRAAALDCRVQRVSI